MRAVSIDGGGDGAVGLTMLKHAHTIEVLTYDGAGKLLTGIDIHSYSEVAQHGSVTGIAEGCHHLIVSINLPRGEFSIALEYSAIWIVRITSYDGVVCRADRTQQDGVELGFARIDAAGKLIEVFFASNLEVEVARGVADGRGLGIHPHLKLVEDTGAGQCHGQRVGLSLLGIEHLHYTVQHYAVAVVNLHAHRHLGTVVPHVCLISFRHITCGSAFFVVPVELHGELFLVEPFRAQVLGLEQVQAGEVGLLIGHGGVVGPSPHGARGAAYAVAHDRYAQLGIHLLGREVGNEGGVLEGVILHLRVEGLGGEVLEVLQATGERALYLEHVTLKQVGVVVVLHVPGEHHRPLQIVHGLCVEADRRMNHGNLLDNVALEIRQFLVLAVGVVRFHVEVGYLLRGRHIDEAIGVVGREVLGVLGAVGSGVESLCLVDLVGADHPRNHDGARVFKFRRNRRLCHFGVHHLGCRWNVNDGFVNVDVGSARIGTIAHAVAVPGHVEALAAQLTRHCPLDVGHHVIGTLFAIEE